VTGNRSPRLPALETVWLVLAPALVFVVTGMDRGYQTELWQHLARGRLIAREGHVVSVDRFTFTVPGRDLYDNNWLSQLLYYGLHSLGGLELVQLANSLALAAAVGLLVHLCRRAAAGSARIAAAVGVCAFLGLWQTLLIRPQSFSMLLFVVLYALLLAAHRRPSLLWLVPPLMALWANVHGGFAVGLLLILAFAGPEVLRRLTAKAAGPQPLWPWLACPVAAALATLLNPYGWGVYLYAGNLSALGVARGIEEWLPPSLGTLIGLVFLASLGCVAGVALRSRERLTLRDVCILIGFALPACMSVRMTVWWFLAAAPVAARLLAGLKAATAPEDRPRASPAAGVALAGIMLVCLGSLPWLEGVNPLFGAIRSPHRTESALGGLVEALPAGRPRIFARMEWANFLAWRLEGQGSVFVEGHVELYPQEVWDQYVTVNDGRPGWQDVLDRHDVRFLLLDQTYQSALLSEVRHSNTWSPVAQAADAVLFERRGAEPSPPDERASADPAAGGEE
jgi:hypothetical protein